MFDLLSQKISGVLDKLRNSGRITEKNIEEAVREVRMALLEADVHVSVVRDLLQRIKEKALSEGLIGSLTPQQQFLKIVHDELVQILGTESKSLPFRGSTPHVILLVGLQGSGKTTTAAKLALHYKRKKDRKPFLVPADFYRPAAIEQLKTLAKQIDVPVFDTNAKADPIQTIKNAVAEAQNKMCDLVIIDTAGRLHVDAQMMDEITRMRQSLADPLVLFVADAMTGQTAVSVAKSFHEALKIEGIILTKMDGDAKGGAALSVQAVAQCPIYFIGTGEKSSEFEVFEPQRLVSRLLDRGDILSLVEKAGEIIDEKEAERLTSKIASNDFDLEDFRSQLKSMKKLGSMSSIFSMLPGAKKMMGSVNFDQAENEMKKKEAIINSMTLKERRQPKILNASRRIRIARGSGTQVSDINRFMKEFEQMKNFMGKMTRGKGPMGMLKNFFK